MSGPLLATQQAPVACPHGHRATLEVPAVVEAGAPRTSVNALTSRAPCDVCGTEITIDAPLLLVYAEGLIGAVFVPSTETPVDRDGEDGARLVRTASKILGRPAFDGARALTSAPARLADVVADRIVECDAIAPARVQLEGRPAQQVEDYRAWLTAIRADVGITAIVEAVTQVLVADRWADVLAACRTEPRVGTAVAARVVDRVVAIARTGGDDEVAVAVGRRSALLVDWRARGGDPADLLLTDRHGLTHPTSLGVQAQIDAYFAGRDDAIGVRVDRLRRALAACDENPASPSAPATIALLAAASAELHSRHGPGDLDEALTMLDRAIALAGAPQGFESRDVLRLLADRAVVELDHPDHSVDDARTALGDIQRRAATTLDAGDPFQATTMLNLGTAWLEEGGTTDRGHAQEEGIAWLEQALAAPGITPELEILASANLAAALRVRLTRQPDDASRADALHRTAVALARGLHRPGEPERLVGSLAAMANAATEAGRLDEAVETSREALAIAARTMPETHPTRLRAEANCASILHTRANAFRRHDPSASDADLAESVALTRVTVAAMAATGHPMRSRTEANLAAVLAEPDSSGTLIDADEAASRYQTLLGGLDATADAEVLRTAAWNAGTLALGQGRTADARHAYRIAWDAAQTLADRALLAAAQQTLAGMGVAGGTTTRDRPDHGRGTRPR